MSQRAKPASLSSGLLAPKGQAAPAIPALPGLTVPEEKAVEKPKKLVSLTVKLDAERYQRLLAYGAQFHPRRTNQEIMVAALDDFLSRQGS